MTGWSTRRAPRPRFICGHCRGELPPPDALGRADTLVSWCASCRAVVDADAAGLTDRELRQESADELG